MDVTKALLAYDAVMDEAAAEGRAVTTADKVRAMQAAIAAHEKAALPASDNLPPYEFRELMRDGNWSKWWPLYVRTDADAEEWRDERDDCEWRRKAGGND